MRKKRIEEKKLGKQPVKPPKLGTTKVRRLVEEKKENIVQEEHDDFLDELLKALDKDGDPLEVFDQTNNYPVYDKATHWKLKKPEVGVRFEGPKEFKECLTYYALAGGFSIWFERSSKKEVIVRCGSRPPRIEDPDKECT